MLLVQQRMTLERDSEVAVTVTNVPNMQIQIRKSF